jgi:hypothetical protein
MNKLIGWLLSMSFIIAGIAFAKDYSQTGFMPYTGFSILCFGCVFWLSKTTFQNSKRVMTATTVILIGTGLTANFLLADMAQYYVGLGLYPTWAVCMLLVGIPVMHHIFKTEPPV